MSVLCLLSVIQGLSRQDHSVVDSLRDSRDSNVYQMSENTQHRDINTRISMDMHVLRKLRAFNVHPKLLRLYRSIIEPLVMYCSTCYYPALSVSNRTRLLKISHVAAKIIGLPTPMLSQMIDHAILKKARVVDAESDHPLFTYFHVLPSRRRYRCIKCRSFVPVAIRMLTK